MANLCYYVQYIYCICYSSGAELNPRHMLWTVLAVSPQFANLAAIIIEDNFYAASGWL